MQSGGRFQGPLHGREIRVGELVVDHLAAVLPADGAHVVVVDQRHQTGQVLGVLHELHERLAGARLRGHAQFRQAGAAVLQHETALVRVQKLVHVHAQHGAAPGVHRLRIARRHIQRRVAGEVLAHLPGPVGQAALQQQQGRLHGTGGEDHPLRVDRHVRHLGAVVTGDLGAHTARPAAVGQHLGDAGVGVNAGAVGGGPGQIADQHGLLAFGLAAGQAVPGERAFTNIAFERFHRPAQLVGAGADQLAVAGDLVFLVFLDGEVLFHPVEIRRQLFGGQIAEPEIPLPVLQNKVRGAEAHAAVHHRGAAHAGALQHQQVAAFVGLAAVVLVQGFQAFREALGKVFRGDIGPRFQNHHLLAAPGQLIAGHRAAGAGADDHHVRVQGQRTLFNVLRFGHRQAGRPPLHFAHALPSSVACSDC